MEPNANLGLTLWKIGDVLGELTQEDDVEVIDCIPRRNDQFNTRVTVQFLRRSKHDALLEKTRKKRLSGTTLGLPSSCPGFINEHLCPVLKQLLGKTVNRRKEWGGKCSWTKNGCIFARKSKHTPAILVTTNDDLVKTC